jgi:L-threonylcarbamoyladenylate synthase
MHRLVLSADDPAPDAIAAAVTVLRRGGVVAFPTDTLYGLAVDPRVDEAVERLFALKGRDTSAAVPLIAADIQQAAEAGELREREHRAASAFWPGPLSIVITASGRISRLALAGGDTVAIRVPANLIARQLAAAFGYPITATSANRSGEPPATSADAVAKALPDVDAILDAGTVPGGAPSTIIAFDAAGPTLVRAGAVPWDRVIKSLQ